MNVIHSDGIPDCFIVNVVATYDLGVRLNLKKLAYYRRDIPVKFNPTRFAAMTINVEADGLDQTTALIFGSGNVVHTGSKTEEHARLSAHYLVRFLNDTYGIPARLENFTITNIVCKMKTGFEVDLRKLKKTLGSRAKFNPIKFPACRIRSLDDTNIVVLVYLSGGMVLTGFKDRSEIQKMHKKMYQMCLDHPYQPSGSVSKGEYRLIDRKEATRGDKLNSINRNIKIVTQSQSGQSGISNTNDQNSDNDDDDDDDMDEEIDDTTGISKIDQGIEKEVQKSVKFTAKRGRTNTKDGILYLKYINPSTPIFMKSNATPFISSVNMHSQHITANKQQVYIPKHTTYKNINDSNENINDDQVMGSTQYENKPEPKDDTLQINKKRRVT